MASSRGTPTLTILAAAARLYMLALEKHEAGARYHAVGEEGVSLRDIAEAIGKGLKVPVASISPDQARTHFGFECNNAGAARMAPTGLA
jgi:dTDP-4-dehydrorhamnose reductase